jgi:FKBP-type peptidyl-prolyl cis-trans isomerase FkpA
MAKSYYDSKTPNWQRIVIWVIAIAMAGGTLVGFFFMAIAAQNPSLNPDTIAQEKSQQEYEDYLNSDEYKQMIEEQQKANAERLANLRAPDDYAEFVTSFNADDVKQLTTETLKDGEGATVPEGATISANYTGWTPDGKIFDGTKLEGEDAEPVEFSLSKVISGWSTGLVGKRVGGVYLLTIPSAEAYGEQGSGESIPPNTPLKFLVQIVELIS